MTDIEKIIKDFEYQVNKAHGEGWDFVDLTTEDGYKILKLLKNADLTALDLVVTQIAKKANDDGRFFSPYEVGLILTQHGQHDNRFKWGEVIKYSPSEVEQILNEVTHDG